MFEINEPLDIDFGFGDFRDTFSAEVKESKNIRKDPHNSGSEPHAVDTAIASARNAEARTERNLDYSAAEERDKLTVRSIAAETEDDVGSASWAERQRELAEAARAAAVQQAEAAYRRALADIDAAVAGRAMCLLCCDRPPETVLGPCQHRVCAECLPRLGGKCPWDRLEISVSAAPSRPSP